MNIKYFVLDWQPISPSVSITSLRTEEPVRIYTAEQETPSETLTLDPLINRNHQILAESPSPPDHVGITPFQLAAHIDFQLILNTHHHPRFRLHSNHLTSLHLHIFTIHARHHPHNPNIPYARQI